MNLAISYNINIITGSMPLLKEDGALYNVGYLIRRDGSYEMYEKVLSPRTSRRAGDSRAGRW